MAEGAPLLREYGLTLIVGSNPTLSASVEAGLMLGFCSLCLTIGGVAEWSNALVLKTSVPSGTGGSNPSPSALSSVCDLHLY